MGEKTLSNLPSAAELLRLAQYGDNHEGGAGTAPHACDRNCHRIRRDSIAGAVLASAELCRRSTADRLYERARAAMPGQGSIERLKLRSTRAPKPFATNIGYSVQLPVARGFVGGEGSSFYLLYRSMILLFRVKLRPYLP